LNQFKTMAKREEGPGGPTEAKRVGSVLSGKKGKTLHAGWKDVDAWQNIYARRRCYERVPFPRGLGHIRGVQGGRKRRSWGTIFRVHGPRSCRAAAGA